MSTVARRTGAERSIEIQSADPRIRPRIRVVPGFAVLVAKNLPESVGVRRPAVRSRLEIVDRDDAARRRRQRDFAAVALLAARHRARHAVHHLDRFLARRRRVRIERHPCAFDRLRKKIV